MMLKVDWGSLKGCLNEKKVSNDLIELNFDLIELYRKEIDYVQIG